MPSQAGIHKPASEGRGKGRPGSPGSRLTQWGARRLRFLLSGGRKRPFPPHPENAAPAAAALDFRQREEGSAVFSSGPRPRAGAARPGRAPPSAFPPPPGGAGPGGSAAGAVAPL